LEKERPPTSKKVINRELEKEINLLKDPSSDAHVTGEGALLVDVGALDSGLGSLEA